jgi:hypothetical protein
VTLASAPAVAGADPPVSEPSLAERDRAVDGSALTARRSPTRRVDVVAWRWALNRAEDLKAAEHHVALTLAVHMDPDGAGAFPKVQTLAAACHRSRRTVREALANLTAKGYVLRQTRPGRSSVYSAVIPEEASVVSLSSSQEVPAPPAQLAAEGGPRPPKSVASSDPRPATRPATRPAQQVDPDVSEAARIVAGARKGTRNVAGLTRKILAEDPPEQILAEADRIRAGFNERGLAARAIEDCDYCDPNGWLYFDREENVVARNDLNMACSERCRHDPRQLDPPESA